MGIGMFRRYYPQEDAEPSGPSFSAAAAKLLADEGIDESEYDGAASGASGDVLKSDVQAWLDEGSEA